MLPDNISFSYIPPKFKLMILSLYSATNLQYSMVIQIFCQTERKSLHLVLPCVLLSRLHKTRMICQINCLHVKYCEERAMGQLFQALECCYFDRGTKIILSEVLDKNDPEWEIYMYDIYILSCCLIDNNAHISLYIVFNS